MIIFSPIHPKTLKSENTIVDWKGKDFTRPHIKQACAVWASASLSSLQAPSYTLGSQSRLLAGISRRLGSGPSHSTRPRLNSPSSFPLLGITRLSWQLRFLILPISWISHPRGSCPGLTLCSYAHTSLLINLPAACLSFLPQSLIYTTVRVGLSSKAFICSGHCHGSPSRGIKSVTPVPNLPIWTAARLPTSNPAPQQLETP